MFLRTNIFFYIFALFEIVSLSFRDMADQRSSGIAFILDDKVFNNRADLEDRIESEKDSKDLIFILWSLEIEVLVFKDNTAEEIKDTLNEAAEKEENTDTNSVFLVVMSSGLITAIAVFVPGLRRRVTPSSVSCIRKNKNYSMKK